MNNKTLQENAGYTKKTCGVQRTIGGDPFDVAASPAPLLSDPPVNQVYP